GFHFGVVHPPHFCLVEEVVYRRIVADETETIALKRKATRMVSAVADRHMTWIWRSAGAHVHPARGGGRGENLSTVVHNIVERRVDRVGCGFRFKDLRHGQPPCGGGPSQGALGDRLSLHSPLVNLRLPKELAFPSSRPAFIRLLFAIWGRPP